MLRILTIFVRAGTTTYPEAEARLDGAVCHASCRRFCVKVVVDNALPTGLVESRPGPHLIGGDNRCRNRGGRTAAMPTSDRGNCVATTW